MELNKIINKLEKAYPLYLREEWDNVGLSVGDVSAEIHKILVTLDVTEEVIEKAVKEKCGLIIAHHPLIFKGVQNITGKTLTGKKLIKLIKNNIALYSAHTNADAAPGGLNDFVAGKLGVNRKKIADIKYHDTVKIAFFVPDGYFGKCREKLIKINRFSSEGYRGVTYSADMQETYVPLENSVPFSGDNGETSYSPVKKLEAIVYRNQVKEIIAEIKKIHPYEEPAYEITEIDKRFTSGGIGRIYELEEKADIEEYLLKVKEIFGLESLKAVYEKGAKIRKIGIVNGSGMSFMKKMRENGIDLFLTADIKYHEALEAKEYGLALADIGHYESEKFFGEMITELLEDAGIEVIVFNDEPVFKNI